MKNYKPIGIFNSENEKPYGAPRQGILSKAQGQIVLNIEKHIDCLMDLHKFDRIWLIYDFHQNNTWNPMVQPPRGSKVKRGVLATRSPYRPNSIGLSCVRLEKIENNVIYVSECDLLDGSPILDIKPYIAYADSFPNSNLGWIEDEQKYEIDYAFDVIPKLKWLNEKLSFNVFEVISSQLEYNPTNRKAKRVKKTGSGYVFSIQAWRLAFKINENIITIEDLYSGYSEEDIINESDPYSDKQTHKEFKIFELSRH